MLRQGCSQAYFLASGATPAHSSSAGGGEEVGRPPLLSPLTMFLGPAGDASLMKWSGPILINLQGPLAGTPVAVRTFLKGASVSSSPSPCIGARPVLFVVVVVIFIEVYSIRTEKCTNYKYTELSHLSTLL